MAKSLFLSNPTQSKARMVNLRKVINPTPVIQQQVQEDEDEDEGEFLPTLPDEYQCYADFADFLLQVLYKNPTAIDPLVYNGEKNLPVLKGLILKIHRTLGAHVYERKPTADLVIKEYWSILNRYVVYVIGRYCKVDKYYGEMQNYFQEKFQPETTQLISTEGVKIGTLVKHCETFYGAEHRMRISICVAADIIKDLIPKEQ